jgi:peroxiredoxin
MRTTALALLLSSLMLVAAAAAPAAPAEVGQPAPDFTLKDAGGQTHHLADYRGRIVVLEWTNPQCPFVQRHYSAKYHTMIDLQARVAKEDVVWLAVDSSKFVTEASAAAWAKKEKIPYPILLDAAGTVGRAYGAKTTPHMFVISKKGILLYEGAIDDSPRGDTDATNYVAAALDEVLAGKPVTHASTKPYGCSVKYAPEESAGAR